MENYNNGILEDRAYQAAIFFENSTINSLKEMIIKVEISSIPKGRNMKTPKNGRKQTFSIRHSGVGAFIDDTIFQDIETPEEDTKTKRRRKQTFLRRNSGEGMFIDDTVLQEDLAEKWVNTHFEWLTKLV